MSVPNSYMPATWSGVTATDGEYIGLSFTLDTGEVVRLKLPATSARWGAESIGDYLPETHTHSDSSSGSPSSEVSTHDE